MYSIADVGTVAPRLEHMTHHRPEPDPAHIQDMQLRHACSEFESVLYSSMLKSMRSAIPKTDLMYGGSAEDIFTSMLDDEYARLLSHTNTSRFSEALYEQLAPRR